MTAAIPATPKYRHRWKILFVSVLVALASPMLRGCFRSPDTPYWPSAKISWPLDHTGTRRVRLDIPPGYNLGAAADAMERMVYPNGRPKDPHNIQAGLLLETLWPDIGPRTWGNDKEFDVPGGGRLLTILVQSGAFDPKVHSQDRLHIGLNVELSFTKRVCVPAPPAHATCHEMRALDRKPPRFGLKRIGVDFSQFSDLPKEEYRHYDDIYYTPELGGGLETYIKCTADEMPTRFGGHPYVPQCTQYFVFKPLNAWVSVNYRRVYLNSWRSIESSVEGLLRSFIARSEFEPR